MIARMTAGGASASDLRLIIRADASPSIGTGHVMRCLALGQAWQAAGGQVTLVSHDLPPSLAERARTAGASVEPALGPLGDLRDATHLATVVTDPRDRLVIDGPGLTLAVLATIEPVAERTLVIDDLAKLERYPVSIVVNQNAHAGLLAYPPGTRLLGGLRWAILRHEFVSPDHHRRRPPSIARRLLIAFGGTDPAGLTRRTTRLILGSTGVREIDRLELEVVVAATNPDADAIAALTDRQPRAHVRGEVMNMANLMAEADMAITSGGTTVWELARMGVPSLVVETSPVEAALASGLRDVGLFDTLGPAESLNDATIIGAVGARASDLGWRRQMATRGPRLVDGKGATRVAVALAAAPGALPPDLLSR